MWLLFERSCWRHVVWVSKQVDRFLCHHESEDMYTVSPKNDTGVTHYRFNPHQPILVIFGRDVAERVCYWMVIYYPTSPN